MLEKLIDTNILVYAYDTSEGRKHIGIFVMKTNNIKEEARRLLGKLPEEVTWVDIMHEIYVLQAIEAGLKDSKAGRTTPVEHVRETFGLSK